MASIQSASGSTDGSSKEDGTMRIESVNVGMPREVLWHGRTVTTGIFKAPVDARVAVQQLNLDGDGQADLTVHGGKDKAIYCYSSDHYRYWKAELPGRELSAGAFGENLTIDGPGEEAIFLGDRYRLGTAETVVTQPRLPCYKLGLKFGDDGIVKRFLASGRTGFYLAVTREGSVSAGDQMELIAREADAVPVSELPRLYKEKRYSPGDLKQVQRLLEVKALPDSWKRYFRERLGGMAR
jgi:MOSC domain-containing protein YiiM